MKDFKEQFESDNVRLAKTLKKLHKVMTITKDLKELQPEIEDMNLRWQQIQQDLKPNETRK